jgi:hypothetical protein
MASTNGKPQPADLPACFEPTAQVIAAERFAKALMSAFDACAELGAPLTQRQRVLVVESALLEFDGFDADLRLVALIRDALHAHERRPAA